MASSMKIVKRKQSSYLQAQQLESDVYNLGGKKVPKGWWAIFDEDGSVMAFLSPEKMLAEFDFIEIPPAGILN